MPAAAQRPKASWVAACLTLVHCCKIKRYLSLSLAFCNFGVAAHEVAFSLRIGVAVVSVCARQRHLESLVLLCYVRVRVEIVSEVYLIVVALVSDMQMKDLVRISLLGIAFIERYASLALVHDYVS